MHTVWQILLPSVSKQETVSRALVGVAAGEGTVKWRVPLLNWWAMPLLVRWWCPPPGRLNRLMSGREMPKGALCLAPCMPVAVAATSWKGNMGPPWKPEGKTGNCPSSGIIRGFFRRGIGEAGENGAKWMGGMVDTSSTSHGLTRFTFCSRSGSSHVT